MSSPMVMRLSRPALRPSHLCLALCILLDPLHAFNPQLPSSSFHRTIKGNTAFPSSNSPHSFASPAGAAVTCMRPCRRHVLIMDAASAGGWPPYHGDNDDSSSSSGGSGGQGSNSGGSEFGGIGSSSGISSSPSSAANVPASFPPPPSSFFNPDFEDDDQHVGTHNSEDSDSDSASSSTSSTKIDGSCTLGKRVPWIEGRATSEAQGSLPANTRRRARLHSHRHGGMEDKGEGRGGNGRRDEEKRKGPAKFSGVRTSLSETDEQGRFVRSPSVHRNWIEPEGKYRSEANRYHLYVSLACPWSARCLMVLYLKGLDNAISISVTHPTWTRTRINDELDHHTGWVFRSSFDPPLSSPAGWGAFSCDGCIPDYINGARTIRDLYELSKDTEGKYTVPVLWDKATSTIVNNESGDIMKMLNDNFNFLAMNPTLNLKPLELAKAVDQYNLWLHENINDGVYKCGFATSQAAYEEAVEGVVGAMDHAEALLGRQRYLLGDRLTEADVRLFPTLVRFDEVYNPHFKCNRKSILKDYPNLLNYAREIFQLPGVALSVNMQHIKTHYYSSHPTLEHFAMVPAGPRFLHELYKAHDRERFPRRRVGLW